ncbi:MAG TPA: hypothetical protein VH079_10540 [Terriglobales bacterium]|jgi:hypothetical protein|nr:hypothetical protein [Terriglobales bacterium]
MLLSTMTALPEFVAANPITLTCPRCNAQPDEACDMLDDMVELIHFERIEAALTLDRAAKAKRKNPYSVFVDWMAHEAERGVKFLTMDEALAAFESRNHSRK